MFKRLTACSLVLALLMALAAVSVCSAAPAQSLDRPTSLKVRVDVPDPVVFWKYPYITADGFMHTPAAVQLVWSTTNGMKTDRCEIVASGKNRGQFDVITERNAFVDIEVQVIDAKKVVLGKANLQVRNTGQEVGFVISHPEVTAPVFEVL